MKLPILILCTILAVTMVSAMGANRDGVLVEPIRVPLVMDGKQVGSSTVPVGSRVSVVEEKGGKVLVAVSGGQVWVEAGAVSVAEVAEVAAPAAWAEAAPAGEVDGAEAPTNDTESIMLVATLLRDTKFNTQQRRGGGEERMVKAGTKFIVWEIEMGSQVVIGTATGRQFLDVDNIRLSNEPASHAETPDDTVPSMSAPREKFKYPDLLPPPKAPKNRLLYLLGQKIYRGDAAAIEVFKNAGFDVVVSSIEDMSKEPLATTMYTSEGKEATPSGIASDTFTWQVDVSEYQIVVFGQAGIGGLDGIEADVLQDALASKKVIVAYLSSRSITASRYLSKGKPGNKDDLSVRSHSQKDINFVSVRQGVVFYNTWPSLDPEDAPAYNMYLDFYKEKLLPEIQKAIGRQ